MSMEIDAEAGDCVVFANPTCGWPHDQDVCARLLTVGAVYTIEAVDIGESATTVYLLEFPNVPFNSVMFDDA